MYIFSFGLFYWSPVENRGTYKITLLRSSVHLFVAAFLKNHSKDFPKLHMKLRTHKGSNVTLPFFNKNRRLGEFLENQAKMMFFFTFRKIGSKDFLNLFFKMSIKNI